MHNKSMLIIHCPFKKTKNDQFLNIITNNNFDGAVANIKNNNLDFLLIIVLVFNCKIIKMTYLSINCKLNKHATNHDSLAV